MSHLLRSNGQIGKLLYDTFCKLTHFLVAVSFIYLVFRDPEMGRGGGGEDSGFFLKNFPYGEANCIFSPKILYFLNENNLFLKLNGD